MRQPRRADDPILSVHRAHRQRHPRPCLLQSVREPPDIGDDPLAPRGARRQQRSRQCPFGRRRAVGARLRRRGARRASALHGGLRTGLRNAGRWQRPRLRRLSDPVGHGLCHRFADVREHVRFPPRRPACGVLGRLRRLLGACRSRRAHGHRLRNEQARRAGRFRRARAPHRPHRLRLARRRRLKNFFDSERKTIMANLQGFCKDEFFAVREALEKNLDSGADIGASAAVFIDGEPVVDLWGGWLDEAHTQPWQRDTIINVYSTTKTMTALCALILADRGVIDLDAPVAKYWPEFAAAGKERVLVRHLLGHTSGLAGWTEPMTLADMYDLEKSTALLARQEPWWEPGTASGYHTFTIGHLVSGVVSRVTGKTLGQFFAEEVAGPLGADFHIGTGPECDARVARLIPATPFSGPSGQNTLTDRSCFNPTVTPYD